MKTFATTLAAGVFTAAFAQAATLDFTTAPFVTSTVPTTSATVDGVNFSFVATARGADGFRQGSGGLSFGVPGNGMYSISIVADQDMVFNSMTGGGHSLTSFAGQLPFDVSVEGTDVADDLMFASSATQTLSFAAAPVSVSAGEAFLIAVDFDALVGSSIYASARIGSIDFEIAPAVPLPAGLPLMIGAFAGLGALRRKSKSKTA